MKDGERCYCVCEPPKQRLWLIRDQPSTRSLTGTARSSTSRDTLALRENPSLLLQKDPKNIPRIVFTVRYTVQLFTFSEVQIPSKNNKLQEKAKLRFLWFTLDFKSYEQWHWCGGQLPVTWTPDPDAVLSKTRKAVRRY